MTNGFYKIGVISILALFLLFLWLLFLRLKLGWRIPFFNAQSYQRVLIVMTLTLVTLIFFNMFGLETFWWGRFIYVNLLMGLYVYGPIQMIGGSTIDLIKRSDRVDRLIRLQIKVRDLPSSFHEIISTEDYRIAILPEFLNYVSSQKKISI